MEGPGSGRDGPGAQPSCRGLAERVGEEYGRSRPICHGSRPTRRRPPMRRLPLLVTIASLCAPVTAAHAWTEPPADDPGRLARFMPLARAAWPGSPCTGREAVHLGANVLLA